jgi:hypothetical protein
MFEDVFGRDGRVEEDAELDRMPGSPWGLGVNVDEEVRSSGAKLTVELADPLTGRAGIVIPDEPLRSPPGWPCACACACVDFLCVSKALGLPVGPIANDGATVCDVELVLFRDGPGPCPCPLSTLATLATLATLCVLVKSWSVD